MLAGDFTETYAGHSDRRELWVADRITPRFLEGMRGLGWEVRSGHRTTVLPLIPWRLSLEKTRIGMPEEEEEEEKNEDN